MAAASDPVVIVSAARTPLGRFGTTDEIANAVIWAPAKAGRPNNDRSIIVVRSRAWQITARS